MSAERGRYGFYRVTRGRLRGHVVYYDDDDTGDRVIVYPGPWVDGYCIVRRTSLEPTDSTFEIFPLSPETTEGQD